MHKTHKEDCASERSLDVENTPDSTRSLSHFGSVYELRHMDSMEHVVQSESDSHRNALPPSKKKPRVAMQLASGQGVLHRSSVNADFEAGCDECSGMSRFQIGACAIFATILLYAVMMVIVYVTYDGPETFVDPSVGAESTTVPKAATGGWQEHGYVGPLLIA
ncbi:hypothetical protein QR680_007540 [Steinernema hermaphroditum]|uniref:Uncharacterized protein n=1 Tax=Steinernema hermaphroditum TaxID=289476 RepID=A0AA39M6A8_9BILA|nr:hypothetical protein QR680_007540 [Steinernema hermaphroditum]